MLSIFVYRMARLCGGTHEISGIHAPLFLRGWVVLGSRRWGEDGVVVCGVVGSGVIYGCLW